MHTAMLCIQLGKVLVTTVCSMALASPSITQTQSTKHKQQATNKKQTAMWHKQQEQPTNHKKPTIPIPKNRHNAISALICTYLHLSALTCTYLHLLCWCCCCPGPGLPNHNLAPEANRAASSPTKN